MIRARRNDHQRGAVLLTVMVIMAVVMLMAGTLTNYFLTSEARDVETSLSNVRIYWAMMGHVSYMLSRAGGTGVCGQAGSSSTTAYSSSTTAYSCLLGKDDDATANTQSVNPPTGRATVTPWSLAGTMQSYAEELANMDVTGTSQASFAWSAINAPQTRRWVYPQQTNYSTIGASDKYYITLKAVVRDHGLNATQTATTDQRLRVDLSVIRPNTTDNVAGDIYDLADRSDRLTVGFCVVDSINNGDGTYNYKGCSNRKDYPSATYVQTGYKINGVVTDPFGITGIQYIMWNAPYVWPTN